MFRFDIKTLKKQHVNTNMRVLKVDEFVNQSFNLNECGWLRNDISELSRCTSKAQYDAMMQKLVQLAQKGDVNPDLSLDEQFALIKPRYAQSYNEIQQYVEMTNGVVHGQIQKAYERSLKDSQKSPEVTTTTTTAPANE